MRKMVAAILAVILLSAIGCGRSGSGDDSTLHHLPDTLRVATLYSPTSYFLYRDQEMGYDFALARRLCADKGMEMELVVAPSLSEMLAMLDSGKVDLVAFEVPVIAEYRDRAVPCGPECETWQVLVQPKRDSMMVHDVTELAGREVYVEADSKYQMRLQNLNDEIGGGIIIHPISLDTLITEDLIAMVSDGTLPLTVVDSDIARLNTTYYRDLDITLQLSLPQQSAWAVSPRNPWLADSINQWFVLESHRRTQAELLKLYFELSKNEDNSDEFHLDFSRGVMSPYDILFKRYAKSIDYDWRLMAAQGYAESHYDTTRVSWAGARGVMQLMPATARAYGLDIGMIARPEPNIATAAKVIADLNRQLTPYVSDPKERMKFVVAAYNSGIAHIYDAIALAGKFGKDPQRWEGNVEEALLMKSHPEYYNDPVCRFGYFRGRQTSEYVRRVMDIYYRAIRSIKS